MTAIAQDFWQEQADEPEVRIDARVDPETEDAYWQGAYWSQPYVRREYSYDDYAPAYCVGYIGFAQYGGRFEDSEKCLCANWIRIKGDSRLTLDDAMAAVRAAWDHAAQAQLEMDEEEEELVQAAMAGQRAQRSAKPRTPRPERPTMQCGVAPHGIGTCPTGRCHGAGAPCRHDPSFSIDDLYLHRKVSELEGSPDGLTVACTVRAVDRNADKYLSCIWAVPLDGGTPRQLTRGPGQDKSARWSPDGRQLAFLSDRAGDAVRVHLLDLDGGEARQLGELPGAVGDLRWAADGRSLLVSAAVPVDPDWRGERARGRKPRSGGVRPEVAWKLPYKADGMGYLLAREIHLFRLHLATGEHQQLTDGPFDALAFWPSPDGRHIAYTRTRAGRFGHRSDLWVCDADGGGARQLTQEFATVMSPVWSPDGRWVAFSATGSEGDAHTNLFVLEFATGRVRQLGDADAQVADPLTVRWSADARAVLFAMASRGRHQGAQVSIDDGKVRVQCQGDRQLGGLAACGSRLVYVIEHPSLPSEVHACEADGQGERQLSDFNPWWKERRPILAETWNFQVPDGKGGTESIEGWLLRAEGSKGPLPLLDDMHGGPAAYALLDFDTNVYWQVLCAQGWAVLALNAVGSASYGREFADRLAGHWGEYDLPQHLAAIRQLQEEGVCDDRVAIAGKSYGGYLGGWAIGHTNQFRAAVVMAPVGNIETHYGTSDGGYYADPHYMGTAPRFDRELAKQLSPMRHVERATTPTLFMQGADDERCPKCQSEELFISLMRAGDTRTELVLYPGQDHHFLGEGAPSCREDAARRIIDWITAHVDQVPAPLRADSQAKVAAEKV